MPSSDGGGVRVREVLAEDVEAGQVVWAHDDGDWMEVHRIDPEGDGFVLTFYRADQSLAEFDAGKTVLVRDDGPAPQDHVVTLVEQHGPFGFLPRCSCGWRSHLHDDRGEAERTATEHRERSR